ncbi:hypothetical protein [Streptomyces boluensis]|uniref:Lipoprotein n=1 Tax=Streptomyces boluensis TaxID=1775135 RepID=A0A964XM79_9ACTN|nr:hypothetical protein [Streptomyces boluensis]NBE52298.1 hypothetical protein [Streptomyces boluensis]
MDGRQVVGALAALVAVVGLAGCGGGDRPGEGGPDVLPKPTAVRTSPPAGPDLTTPTGPATAPGQDDALSSQQVFTGEELKKALLPDSAFGRNLEPGEAHTTPFESDREKRRSEWGFCLDAAPDEDPDWLGQGAYRGAITTAVSMYIDRKANEGHAVAEQTLTSLPLASARELMRVERDIREHCPSFASDAEAGSASEEYEVESVDGIGDEAFLETHTLNWEGEHTSYTLHVRVGGVLLTFSDGEGADRDHTFAWGAQLARHVGTTLYP